VTDRHRALRAQRVAVVTALLTILATCLMFASWRHLPAHPIRDLQFVALIAAAASLVVLWMTRASPSARIAQGTMLVVLAPACAYFWFNDSLRAAQGACWDPFEGNKVAALACALLAPPSLAVGLVIIGGFTASALIHFALMSDAARTAMAAGEPFSTLAYTGIAVAILVYRLRSVALEDEVRQAHAEAALMQEVALISLAIRDLTNTPVQTLEVLRGLLLKPGANLVLIEQRMTRALNRLNELGSLLSRYETAALPTHAVGSLDSVKLLRERIDQNRSERGDPSAGRPEREHPSV
jgi:hypothetical protein